MQYLLIDKNETLMSLSKTVGSSNVDSILSENGIKRTPNVGKEWAKKCNDIISTTPNDVSASRKSALLNSLTGSEEVFEKACLMDENEWKVFSAVQSFPDTLRVPESIKLPYSDKVLGDGDVNQAAVGSGFSRGQQAKSSDPVSPVTYKAVMNGLKESSVIDPSILNAVNTSRPVSISKLSDNETNGTSQYSFNLPWGKIQLYSSLLDEVIDFPAYPEEVTKARQATYTQMPDLIYQYEPWICYQNSGPREQSLTFHMHRDMWSGNHLDGNATRLINFCEANTFPRYSGSTVLPSTVRLYIDGSLFVAGVMTNVSTIWRGPIGQDNWYLEFELTITIQEVSETALSIDSVRNFGLIGS